MKNGTASATPPPAPPWPALKVERRALAKLTPSARNARQHTADQVGEIAASIKKWGWTMSVLVDEDDTILAGHGRVLAAERLGIERVPVVVARGWTMTEKRAYAIADNKVALNAAWDWDMLALEVGDLRSLGEDMAVMGFNDLEVASLLAEGSHRNSTLASTDPTVDATWPTLEIKMPPELLDRVRTALDGTPPILVSDWQRLEHLVFADG